MFFVCAKILFWDWKFCYFGSDMHKSFDWISSEQESETIVNQYWKWVLCAVFQNAWENVCRTHWNGLHASNNRKRVSAIETDHCFYTLQNSINLWRFAQNLIEFVHFRSITMLTKFSCISLWCFFGSTEQKSDRFL